MIEFMYVLLVFVILFGETKTTNQFIINGVVIVALIAAITVMYINK